MGCRFKFYDVGSVALCARKALFVQLSKVKKAMCILDSVLCKVSFGLVHIADASTSQSPMLTGHLNVYLDAIALHWSLNLPTE